jgi:CheY-like chemotaxis protein
LLRPPEHRRFMSTVLIVDDDPGTRVVLRLVLETAGHEVVEAEHGEAALAHFFNKPPDIVMTDLTMPVLDGEALIQRLRSEPATASIPIVVVSGNPAAARALHASGLVEAFVDKPFHATELAECIRALIAKITAVPPEALAG